MNNLFGGQVDQEPVSSLLTEDMTSFKESIYANKNYNTEYLVTEKGEPDMNKLFTDVRMPVELSSKPFKAPPKKLQDILFKKINHKLPVNKSELGIIVNTLVSLDNVITTKADETNEGMKIINFISSQFRKPEYQDLITGLKLFINNGYVHFIREGLGSVYENNMIRSGSDKITPELVPNLSYFNWQYGIPIDYNIVKYTLFQNQFQGKLKQDTEQQKEAEKILSQEYLICMQPEPDFLMWSVKRLIECWYADVDLQNSIRKIKVLVNIYRAKDGEEYNKKHGVLPTIVIYPKYGIINAEIVLKKLLYYFYAQLSVGWEQSNPTYFVKINSLFHYTNASLDLKLYYRNVISASKQSLTNQSFTDSYDSFKDASRIEEIKIIDDLLEESKGPEEIVQKTIN
jgi:hypothetical protein